MRKMSSQVEKVVSIYRSLSQIPALAGAKISNNGTTVISQWSERNIERNKAIRIAFSQEVDEQLNLVSESSFGTDISNVLISSFSPQENLNAIIREQTDAKDSKKQYLEIWKYRHVSQCVDLPALEIHGDVYFDGEFGSLDWDKSGQRLTYIAEKKLPKSEPFYKRQKLKPKSDKEYEISSKGSEYDYKQEWGEQLVGKHLSVAVIFNLESEKFTVVDWLPKTWCPGQVSWSPDGSSITGVAWETEPRRLGLIFCTNRPSFIFNATTDGKYSVISEAGKAVRSPIFSSDGKHLLWLQRSMGGPHHACHQLVKTSWPLQEAPIIETVIDIIDTEITIEGNEKFTGIYTTRLTKQAFAIDGRRLIFSTQQKTEIRTYVVDIESGKITDISDKSMPCSISILDINQDIILASRSSLKQPAQLMIAKLPESGKESTIEWKILSKDTITVPDTIASGTIEYINLEHDNIEDSVKSFTSIYFAGKMSNEQSQPLIVWPHGGPHSSYVNSYSLDTALLCMLGFSMTLVNYRGSVGAGQKSVEFLSGRVGSADVQDCVLATQASSLRPPTDGNRCVLLGGSHGGFLVTHLSGQYPDMYKAVVTRNPVTDIASMLDFRILQINYRGSIGLGQDNLLSLPGKIGKNDVNDCILAMSTVMKMHSASIRSVIAYGKSHGGYLAAMLCGLYPHSFDAAVIKNPVTELISKYNGTDIPDSCAYEAGSEFSEVGAISEELLLAMRRASPLVHAHKVKTPTLLCLGSKDLRVPYSQGLEYYHKIKANGCKARVIVYDDNHSLNFGTYEIDHLINGALWMLEHTQ